jgi:TPR repeat protein
MSDQSYTIEQMVQLALDERSAGNLEAGQKWIHRAENLVLPNDYEGLTALWSAMCLGLGCSNFEESQAKALSYISRVADADNLKAQEIVMIQYLEGTNGFPQDIERFKYWADRAKSLGSELAIKELKKFERKRK